MESHVANIESELRNIIIHVANLQQVDPLSIDRNATLLKGGLGLDSIDLLELIVTLEKKYGLKLRNDEQGRAALSSLASLVDFVSRELEGTTAATTSDSHSQSNSQSSSQSNSRSNLLSNSDVVDGPSPLT